MSIVSPPLSLRQQHDDSDDNNSNHHNTKENVITSGYNETHRTVNAGGGVGVADMVTSGLTKDNTENQTTLTSSLPNSSSGSAENEQQVSLQTIIILLVMGVVVVVYCSKCLLHPHHSRPQSDQAEAGFFLMMCGLWSTLSYIYPTHILIGFVLFLAVTLAVLSKPAMNEIFLVLVSYVIIGTFLMIEICIFYTSGPR